MSSKHKSHVPLPKKTRAFFCANCGAVSLSQDGICKVQGQGTKAEWCGTATTNPHPECKNNIHKLRFKCGSCGTVAVNPELLCEPEKINKPEKS